MTVDMLAATFFWPEGLVLGSEQSPPGLADSDADTDASSDGETNGSGFWAAVSSFFSRSTSGEDTAVQV